MAAKKKRRRPRRRKGRFSFLYKLLSFPTILVALAIGSAAFFRVNQIVVTGNVRYSSQEITDASGILPGSYLFLVNKPQTQEAITRQLPYIESVRIVRRLPDTLELRISESTAAGVLSADGSWWLIDMKGKILQQGDSSLLDTAPELLGLHALSPQVGDRLSLPEEDQLKFNNFKNLLGALLDQDLGSRVTDFVDLSAANVIRFGFDGQLTVIVPQTAYFSRIIFAFKSTLETFAQLGEPFIGTLDLTYGDERARLLPTRWMPSSDAPETPDPEASPENSEDSEDPEPAEDPENSPTSSPKSSNNPAAGTPSPAHS